MVVPGIFSRPGEHKTHLDNHLFLVSMGSLVLFEGRNIIQTWTMRNTLSLSTDYVKYVKFIYLALFTIHIFFKNDNVDVYNILIYSCLIFTIRRLELVIIELKFCDSSKNCSIACIEIAI